MWFTSVMGAQAGAEQSTFEAPHQNVLHKSSGRRRRNNTAPAFKSDSLLLAIEYSHAQNQLNKCTSYNFMHGDVFQLLPSQRTAQRQFSLFLFCAERWRAEVWQRGSSRGQTGSLSRLAICLSSNICVRSNGRNLSFLKTFCFRIYTTATQLLQRHHVEFSTTWSATQRRFGLHQARGRRACFILLPDSCFDLQRKVRKKRTGSWKTWTYIQRRIEEELKEKQ